MSEERINPLQQIVINDLKQKIGAFKQDFDEVEEMARATIPEAIFVRDFLPLFCGETAENVAGLKATWYLIAGSPYNAVNVVDAMGAVVATVPPLLDRKLMFPNANRQGSLAFAFERAKQSASMSPRLAESIIQDEINARFAPVQSADAQNDLKKAWEVLFTHYKKASHAQSAAVQADSELDL